MSAAADCSRRCLHNQQAGTANYTVCGRCTVCGPSPACTTGSCACHRPGLQMRAKWYRGCLCKQHAVPGLNCAFHSECWQMCGQRVALVLGAGFGGWPAREHRMETRCTAPWLSLLPAHDNLLCSPPVYSHNSSSRVLCWCRQEFTPCIQIPLTCSSLACRSFSSARTMRLLRASAWVTRSSSSSLVLPSESVCTARQGMIHQQAVPIPCFNSSSRCWP